MDHDNDTTNPDDNAALSGQEGEQIDQRQDADHSAEDRLSASSAFLDSLVDDDAGSPDGTTGEIAGQPRDEHGRFAVKPGQAEPQQTPPADGLTPGQPAPAAEGQQQPVDEKARQAQEDAELLEGIKSERGRERVQKLIAERNETKAQAEQVTASLGEIQKVVQDAGMDAEQFAQHIEFSRLLNSNDPKNLNVAAQMVEQVRADIYKRLGKDAPGVDVLADFPDLAQRVSGFEISREAALEIAQYRRQQQQAQQKQQTEQQYQQEDQQFQQALKVGIDSAQSYLQSRANEVDHPARMEVLQKYFADQNNLQEFARTYRPDQMAHAIKFMYDNVQVAPRQPSPSPLRSRPSPLGAPAPNPNDAPIDRMASVLDQMGI